MEKEKPSDILSVLKSSVSNTNDIIPECADRYCDALAKAKEHKSKSGKLFRHLTPAKFHFEYDAVCGITLILRQILLSNEHFQNIFLSWAPGWLS